MTTRFSVDCLLIDGSSYLFRAYHALPSLTNSDGMPTGAVYGVLTMIRKLLEETSPQFCAVVFDTKAKTFRSDIFPAYKAHRPEMPEDLAVQIEPLYAIITAMGLPLLRQEGFEADDIIGSLAKEAEQLGLNTLISTSDKDLAQLVGPRVHLINTMTQSLLDPEGVVEKFGVPPERIVDYLTLVGDTSDNVPGVSGVGPKTAVKWLQQYGDLATIIAEAPNISGKVGENLRSHLPFIETGKQLVTIHCEVPLQIHLKDCRIAPEDTETLVQWLSRLGFQSLLRNIKTQASPSLDTKNHSIIRNEEALKAFMQRLQSAEIFAFDTETTSLDPLIAQLVGVSFALPEEAPVYVPIGHQEKSPQCALSTVLATLQPLLENENVTLVGQNVKYDRRVLSSLGIELKANAHDTMLESYVLNSTAGRHDLDSLAERHLGHTMIAFETVAGKGKQQKTFDAIEITTAAEYAAEDAQATLMIHHHLFPKLQQAPTLHKVYETIEKPLVEVLARIEHNGVLIDAPALHKMSEEFSIRLQQLEEEAYKSAGKMFNLQSPKQLQEILFGDLGLPVVEKTPSGQPSTAENVLQELSLRFDLPKIILEHRTLSKLKSTYTDRLPQQIHPLTGRVHTSFHQAVTSTGRLSSSDPNLQNIPIRTEAGRRIREAFIAPPGCLLIAADYSQIELRIMAHLSEDPTLLAAFQRGDDVHASTASEIFSCSVDSVTEEQRRIAKTINFGLIYGMSAFGLAKQLGLERSEANAYVERYFQRYPGVKTYMESTRQKAFDLGYVETLFGRRLYVPDIRGKNPIAKRAAERAAINAPMQGTSADIIKLAMIKLDHTIKKIYEIFKDDSPSSRRARF